MNHGQNIAEWNPYILSSLGITTKTDSRSTYKGPIVVRCLKTFLVMPLDLMAIGQNGSSNGCTIVATNSNQHETSLWNSTRRAEFKLLLKRFRNKFFFAVGASHTLNVRVLVLILSRNKLIRVI